MNNETQATPPEAVPQPKPRAVLSRSGTGGALYIRFHKLILNQVGPIILDPLLQEILLVLLAVQARS